MGADNHPTTVPTNHDPHTATDLLEAIEESDAFMGAVRSCADGADVHAQLKPDYDTCHAVPEWASVENVYWKESDGGGYVGVWLTADD